MGWKTWLRPRAWLNLACVASAVLSAQSVQAQIAVSSSGQPTYSQAIAVPPGIGGMQPNLSLLYAGGGVNGPVGYGWSLQGISSISRCPATRYMDGQPRGVKFDTSDKLCLDGQRLIQTDASGVVTPAASFDGSGKVSAFPQVDDAKGLAGATWREYRTEKDSYSRIRAYGAAGDVANGPQYFKVWTKAGQIFEYGTPPSADANTSASILAQGKSVVMVWAVARISDVVGNYIDFKYENRDKAWGSYAYGQTAVGREWNLKEVQYTGNGSQLARNKVVLRYTDRTLDAAEAYQQGSKNVSVRLLTAIDTYVNSPSTALMDDTNSMNALFVRRVKLTYDNGAQTQRSRVVAISDCADLAGVRCTPPARFTYSDGGLVRNASANFNLGSANLATVNGKYGVMVGDFNGDGRTDLIRWSEIPSEVQLLQSNGDGSFTQVGTNLTALGTLNLANGCISSTAADANADGLVDIIRVFNPTASNNSSCDQTPRAEFLINQGGGNFVVTPLLDTNGAQIPFARKVSEATFTTFCGPQAANDVGLTKVQQLALALAACNDNPRTGWGWTDGATYYFMDVNGDGRLDIVTATLEFFGARDPLEYSPPDDEPAFCSGCTKVYLAQPDGRFARTPSNVDDVAMYSDPGRFGALNSWSFLRDTNGDGLVDLFAVGAPRRTHAWTSDGRGGFNDLGFQGIESCLTSLDYNGDGRADCLQGSTTAGGNQLYAGLSPTGLMTVTNFNLHGSGQELDSKYKNVIGSNFGVYAIDLNGDGREDLIRWHDNATLNKIYLSNGDGTFREVAAGTLGTLGTAILGQSDGTYDLVMGDFRGLGKLEMLRISRNARDLTNPNLKNLLFVPTDTAISDRLDTYVSPAGLKTKINYVPNTSAEGRVVNDAGTANKAQYPLADISMAGQIVASVDQETGFGTTTVRSEFGYVGMKAAVDGRGLLGFRRTVQQSTAPNGEPLSVWTDFLSDEPYSGVAQQAQTRRGAWNNPSGMLISQTVNVYCDRTSTTSPDAATTGVPCATNARVTRPYLRQSVESGWDLDGTALPSVTTTNTYNDFGDPIRIVQTTSGNVAGVVGQSTTKVTDNTFCAPDTAGCGNKISGDNWILGRLSRATVTNTVPKLIDSMTASPGGNAGGNPPGTTPVSAATMQIILQLLLDD